MYVNLDYYGSETEINVVKGCSTNGVTEYTDYGIYEKVENMTDSTEPSVGNGSVTWKFPDKNQRFYYQCTLPKEEMELPWTFDISYKLNGVETEPKALNGASAGRNPCEGSPESKGQGLFQKQHDSDCGSSG